jgi:drug/metabolite transporter (DMT)-like permease
MKKLYLILPILAGFMFGSSGVFVRTLTQNGIDSTTLLFLRFSIAILPIVIAIFLTDKELFKIDLKDIPLFLVCAMCIVGLNICYNESMNTVPLSLAAVLLSLAPIYVLILAYIFFGEKITSKKLICMALAIFGCILMTGVLETVDAVDITPDCGRM